MPECSIVCNTGPLIALSTVDCLDLLHALYDRVCVPDAVFREIMDSGGTRPRASEIAAAPWLQAVSEQVRPEPLLTAELGPGEAAVIATAGHFNARLVLIDERRARRIAEHAYGLRVKGSAGVLVAARRAGLVREIRPLLEKMATEGYFLSRRLIERACAEVGE